MGCAGGVYYEEGEKNKLVNSGFEKAIVYIENKGNKGIGILCRLPLPKSSNVLPALITTQSPIPNPHLFPNHKKYY